MLNSNLLIMAYDGDNAGRLCGRAVLANDPDALAEVSDRINLGHDVVRKWVEANGGKVISGGGDEGTFAIPQEAVENLEELRNDYQFATNLTMTIGVGKNLSEAGKALLAGKLRGKNTTVNYDESVDPELQNAHQRVSEGAGSEEDKKLDDAYLSDNQKDPENKNKASEEQQANSDGKDFNPAANRENPIDNIGEGVTEQHPSKGSEPTAEEDKEIQEQQQSKFDPDGEKPNGTESKAHPNAQDASNKESEDNPMNDKSKTQPIDQDNKEKVNEKSKENDKKGMEELKEEVNEASPQSESKDKEEIKNIDEPALATENVKDETSDDKDPDQNPRDMGLGNEKPAGEAVDENDEEEEDPNYQEVLGDAIASEQENIQKEKVIQMVAEALQGFKQQKAILERAKEQAPELYNSSIAMLRAMIEMAKLLGFGEGLEDPEVDNQQAAADQLFAENDEEIPPEEEMPKDDQPFKDGSDAEKIDEEESADNKEDKPSKSALPPKKDIANKKPEPKEKAPEKK